MTTAEMIKELNRRGYVCVLFNYNTWSVEDEKPIPIQYTQSQVNNGFYDEFDEVFGNVMETIYNDDVFEDECN